MGACERAPQGALGVVVKPPFNMLKLYYILDAVVQMLEVSVTA